jgi:hypothetical protein
MRLLAAEIAAVRAEDRDVCVVILDTMTSVFDGVPENDNGAMGRVMALLSDWAVRNDVAVLMPHHMPKANGRSGGAGDLSSARGASALGGGVRIAVTLTALDDDRKASLSPDMRDRVVQMDGAKANHDEWVPRRYFVRELPPITVVDEDGNTDTNKVPVMVPFRPNFGWDPKADNSKLEVLCAVAAAEKPAADMPEGNPLRVQGGPKTKSAADVLAERWDEDPKAIADTIKGLASDGLLERGQGPRSVTGNYPTVWRVSAAGADWIRAKQAAVLAAVADDVAETPAAPIAEVAEPEPTPPAEATAVTPAPEQPASEPPAGKRKGRKPRANAAKPSVAAEPETPARILDGLEEINFAQAAG